MNDTERSNMLSETEKLHARIKILQENETNHLNDWEKTNKDIEKAITVKQKELADAKSATAGLTASHADAQQRCTQMKNNRKAELDRLGTELHAAQKQLADLQKTQKTYNHKTSAKQTTVQQKESDIVSLQGQIKKYEQEKAALSVDIFVQNHAVQDSNSTISSLYLRQEETKQKYATLDKEIEDLQKSGSHDQQIMNGLMFARVIEKRKRERASRNSFLEQLEQAIVQQEKEAQKELRRLRQKQQNIERDQEEIRAQLKQARDDLISAENGLNTLGGGQQPMQQQEHLIQRQAAQVDTLKREMDNRSGYTPAEQEIRDAEKESEQALFQNQELCRQKTKELQILREEKVNKKNAYDQETKARKDRIDAIDLEINNQPKQLEKLRERREKLGEQTKKIEEEISRLIKERDNGQKILDALCDEKAQAQKNMNALSQSLDQIQPDVKTYLKQVAHSLTASIMGLGCKNRAVYMSRLWGWALKEQSGIGGSTGGIPRFCAEVKAKLNKAEDRSPVEAEVRWMLGTIPGILSVGQMNILKVNGGTIKTSCGHACGDDCNVCIAKSQPINQTGFTHIVSVVDKVNSVHPTACRIARTYRVLILHGPVWEGVSFDVALACWNVAKADNLDDHATNSLVSAVVWACQHYNSTEYKTPPNNLILMRAELAQVLLAIAS